MSMSPVIYLVYGPQGAGKTTYARTLADQTQGARFSIDEWIVTLFGPDLPQPLDFAWVMARVERCHAQIWALTRQLVERGTPVVLDLGFLRAEDRQRAREQAERCGATAAFHLVDAPAELRRTRVLQRNETRGDTFSLIVTPGMFDLMESVYEAPGAAELVQARQVTFSHV
ncbi:AAA family ATPase [Deinococcus hohokamensis]|uniref:AAA family ATPase n=1 Tax=Deinococcus hohokamensis TaxID=309883 RepID=A0ABV9I687_9DEIO